MSLKKSIFGGLISSLMAFQQINAQQNSSLKQLESWNYGNSSEERVNYWILEGNRSLEPFLAEREVYCLKETYPNTNITHQVYCHNSEIRVATNLFSLKNIGKVQPHTPEASYKVSIAAKINSNTDKLNLNVDLEANEIFVDMYTKLNMRPIPTYLHGEVKSIGETFKETDWIVIRGGNLKKEIELGANAVEFRPQRNNYWQVDELTNMCLFTIEPLSPKKEEQKRESSKLQKLFKAEEGKPHCRKIE